MAATHQYITPVAAHLLGNRLPVQTTPSRSKADGSFRNATTTFDAAVDTAKLPVSLEGLVAQVPDLKLYTRSSPQYETLREVYNLLIKERPLVICRPTTVSQISAVVAYCSANELPLAIRSGGHAFFGLSCVADAVILDMREMDSQVLAADRQTVTIGGGVASHHLTGFLDTHGLGTAMGSSGCGYVGWTGWAISGGYGPLASHLGLGLDNIVGARLVNAQGQLIAADEELLWAIRGAGANFGVIVELDVKVYSMPEMLGGFIIYDEQKSGQVLKKCQELLAQGIPDALGLEIGFSASENGVGMSLIFAWADQDFVEGRKWLEIVRALGPIMADTVGKTTYKEFQSLISHETAEPVNICTRSVNVPRLSAAIIENLIKHSKLIPAGAGHTILARICHGVMVSANPATSFGTREDHVLLQIHGIGNAACDILDAELWADMLVKDMRETGEVMRGGYPSFMSPGSMKEVFGEEKYERLIEVKRKVDAGNLFKSAIAAL